MSSWARASTSAAILALGAVALPSSFGRFGWTSTPVAPGFRFSETGFAAEHPNADTFRWGHVPPSWKVDAVSERAAHYESGGLRLESDLRAPGFVAESARGIDLETSALLEPLLTTQSATFGPGIEGPASPWVLVTLGDAQPPILACGLDAPLQAVATGAAGRWVVRLQGARRIRFALPQGLRPVEDRTARTLGSLASRVSAEAALWSAETPRLQSVEAREEQGSIVAVFTYDRPGAVVPPALLLAKEAGCQVQTVTGVRQVAAPMPDGPTAFSLEPKLVVRLPFHPFAPGRAVATGYPGASATDDSATQVLLGSLCFGPGQAEARAAVREGLVATLVRGKQPMTGVMIGYGPDGAGSYPIALLALLRRLQAGPGDPANPSRNELLWAFDPRSLSLWLPGQEAAEAQAILALALSLETAPERRLYSSFLALGLVARSELARYRSKHGLAAASESVPALRPLARRLCGLPEADPWIRACDSPLRVHSAPSTAAMDPGGILRWDSGGELAVFELSAPAPVALEGLAGTRCSVTGTEQFFRLEARAGKAGQGRVRLTMDRFDRLVPRWPGWPQWVQGLR